MSTKILPVLVIVLLAGCQSSEKKALEAIKKQETSLYSDDNKNFRFDEKLAREAITSYENFAQQYPKSKEAPEMLLKSADLHRSLKEYEVALNIYKRIENDFPDFDKKAQVIFLQGFVYENELFRLELAKERYETFLKLYPNHELADDVQFSLKNLGKSPEEIIKGFEQNEPAKKDTPPS